MPAIAHELIHPIAPGGRWRCTRCHWTWQRHPKTLCPGVPRYTDGTRPPYAKTQAELYAAGYLPQGEPVGCYMDSRNAALPWVWYFDSRTAIPAAVG